MLRKYLFFSIFIGTVFCMSTSAQEHSTLIHGGSVHSVAYSPINSSLIASAGGNHTIKLWDLSEGVVTTLGTHEETVNSISFSPDGKYLVSGSDDTTMKLWDVTGKRHLSTLTHATDRYRAQIKVVTFSPDGQKIVSAGLHVKMWDIHTLREIMTIRHSDWIFAVAFSSDGKYLAMGDTSGQITVRNLQTQKNIAQFRGDADFITALRFSPDDQILASSGYNGSVKLWKLPKWDLIGTLATAGTVSGLSFSPDGSILAGTDYEAVNLWSTRTGDQITTLLGHVGWVYSTSFSPDGTFLTSSGSDGTLRLWDISSFQTGTTDMVRIIYFVPSNRTAQFDMWTKLDSLIRDVQSLYADQMEADGYGRKTFTIETDENAQTVVYRVDGNFSDFYYRTDTSNKILDEVSTQFDMDRHIYLIVAELSSQAIEEEHICGVGGSRWIGLEHKVKSRGGYAVIPASGDCFDAEVGTIVTAHELGHAFGLDHDFRDDSYIMSYGNSPNQFSHCATEWLSVSRFFNADNITFNNLTSIHILTSDTYPPNASDFSIIFQITDLDGIHQVQLLVPTTDDDPATGTKLHSCQLIDTQSSAVEFDISSLTSYPMNKVQLQVIDVYGNITRQEYVLIAGEEPSAVNRLDVNGDGTVDTADLVLVAAHFGETIIGSVNPNPDVNRDGVVNIIDLLLVVNELNSGDTAAPPYLHHIPSLNPITIQQWIDQAKGLPFRGTIVENGIEKLEQLLTAMMPHETRLLVNYPNPFNPETWIPYQLASDADVRITIYDVRGHVVRTLDLGPRSAGTYFGRDSAAYWDGKNDRGELVVSGVYVYTFSAGSFRATRRMLLRK